MSNNVGSMNFKLVSEYDNKGIRLAMQDVDNAKKQLTESSPMTALGTGGVGKAGARNVQQVGFMIQDFSSQIMNSKNGIDGLGRGFAAISNNIQMMGQGMSPTTQAMVAIGGAATGIIAPAIANWLADTAKIEALNKRIESSYERMKALIEGMSRGSILGQEGPSGAEKAKAEIDKLTNRISGMSRTSMALKNKIIAEMDGENRQHEIEAMRKHQLELTDEIRRAEAEKAGIQETWTNSRLKKELDAIEEEKKAKAAAATEEQDNEKTWEKLKANQRAEEQAQDEQIRRQYDMQQSELRNKIEDLQHLGTTSNGPSAANAYGTSGAASAIARAAAGTRSEENDRKHQIKVLEDQLKTLNRLEQKMNFKRAGLLPA